MPNALTDRVIAITGASSGIGAATALECARAGMHVALAARNREPLEEVAQQVRALGVRALPVVCDVTSESDVRAFVDATVQEFGRLDVMFANAGYGLFASVMETTDDLGRAIFETNFYGTIHAIHAAVPVMRKQGHGHILICSSAAAEVSPPMYGFYGATKAAQQSIAQSLRAELAAENIAVTSVLPVGTRTKFFDCVQSNGVTRRCEHGHGGTPPGMIQSPEHVARRIVKAIRRPRAEVWPHRLSRVGIAIGTLFPGLPAWALRKHMRKFQEQIDRTPIEHSPTGPVAPVTRGEVAR